MAGNFIDRVTDIYDLVRGRSGRQTDGSSFGGRLFTQHSSASTAGPQLNLETILRETTTMTCLNVIMQGISQLPISVRSKDMDGKYTNLPEHPITLLLSRPNKFQTASEFQANIVSSMLVSGNAFIRILRAGPGSDVEDGMNTKGRPYQLVVLDSDEMSIGADALGSPVYHHDTEGRSGTLAAENVIHIRDFSTFAVQGQSRIHLAVEVIGAKIAADRLVGYTFRRGINPKYAIELDAKVQSPELKAEMQEQLAEQFGIAGQNSGGAILIEGGKINPIKGMTPADSELLELREKLKLEIAGVMRVPAHMVGATGDEKFNNVRQKLASFHRDTLNPIIKSFEEALRLKLLDNPNEYIYYDVSELLKGDIETETKLAVLSAGGPVITINEARKRIGLNPMDGDEYNEISMTSEPEMEGTDSPTGGEDGPRAEDREEESDE